ncbi:hypothetical protein [Pleionea sp. CnH1-48]|uniref:hypothetical protein n=1 Tax=Pleionea sp. CnH1-48 TaxID=2954494 RepID=UPI0020971A9F|nr:hypothetical protein [Pleionea sp. CnH1-48]MCO7223209.1 hypothetical protein [Pleionea sp. CnH1-48]
MKKFAIYTLSLVVTLFFSLYFYGDIVNYIVPEGQELLTFSIFGPWQSMLIFAGSASLCALLFASIGLYHNRYKPRVRWFLAIAPILVGVLSSAWYKKASLAYTVSAISERSEAPLLLTLDSLSMYMIPLSGFFLGLTVLLVSFKFGSR